MKAGMIDYGKRRLGVTLGRRDLIATLVALSTASNVGASGGAPVISALPDPKRFVPGRGDAWWTSTGMRIVAGGQARPEAERLAGDLVAYGLIPVPPPVVARGPQRGDLVLELGDSLPSEGYRIVVGDRGAIRICGGSEAGLFYATRTLLHQMVLAGSIPAGVVEDAPDCAQRGVMIDVGRKYYTPDWLRRLIERMGWLKLNMLHLHLSDNEGFGYASARHPRLASPSHLTMEDLRSLVDAGRRNHVTIVPELDSPGHLGSVIRLHPELALRAVDGTSTGRAIDVSMPGARTLIAELIDEIVPVFPGPWWHLGGDEVLLTEKPDRTTDELNAFFPQLLGYAREQAGAEANVHDAVSLYLNGLNRRLERRGKRCRAWNDGMQGDGVVPLDPSIDVVYWENLGGRLKSADRHIADGARVINTHSRYLYHVIADPPFPWYPHPTFDRIAGEWRLGLFEGEDRPVAEDRPIEGAQLSVWADRPAAYDERAVEELILGPMFALAERSWNRSPAGRPEQRVLAARFAKLAPWARAG